MRIRLCHVPLCILSIILFKLKLNIFCLLTAREQYELNSCVFIDRHGGFMITQQEVTPASSVSLRIQTLLPASSVTLFA